MGELGKAVNEMVYSDSKIELPVISARTLAPRIECNSSSKQRMAPKKVNFLTAPGEEKSGKEKKT